MNKPIIQCTFTLVSDEVVCDQINRSLHRHKALKYLQLYPDKKYFRVVDRKQSTPSTRYKAHPDEILYVPSSSKNAMVII